MGASSCREKMRMSGPRGFGRTLAIRRAKASDGTSSRAQLNVTIRILREAMAFVARESVIADSSHYTNYDKNKIKVLHSAWSNDVAKLINPRSNYLQIIQNSTPTIYLASHSIHNVFVSGAKA